MNIQHLTGAFFLGASIIYALYMTWCIIRDREWFREAPGRFGVTMVLEAVVYFLATVGVSDFLLNTIICQRLRLAEPKTQPDCNISATIVPSGLISFLYLRSAGAVDGRLLAVFIVCMIAGSLIGSLAVGHMNGEVIRRAMIAFLSITLCSLLIKMAFSAGAAPMANALHGPRLVAMGVEAFIAGFMNMLGIPSKPLTATTALVLGLSPVTTLALTVGALPLSCAAGGINVVPRKRYNPKLILSAMTAGCLAALAGCFMAVSISASLLNGILLVVIAVAIISLIKRK